MVHAKKRTGERIKRSGENIQINFSLFGFDLATGNFLLKPKNIKYF